MIYERQETIDPDTDNFNSYYSRISSFYRTVKIVCVFVLCTFILGGLIFFGEIFTNENARYVLRDLGQIIADDSSDPVSKITFDADGEMDYSVYRSNLVVAGASGVDIIGVSGKVKLSDGTTYISPVIESSDKYCIVYSLGAYNLSVYNTVARIFDFKFDYPIYDVAVSDKGDIAVMTQSREYKCTVYLYNSDFKLIATYNKTKYPCSVDFSHDNGSLYITTFSSVDGNFHSELECYPLQSSDVIFTYSINGELPYDVISLVDDKVALITERTLVFLNPVGEVIKRYTFGYKISKFTSDERNVAILVAAKNPSATLYDVNGEVVYSDQFDEIDSIYIFEGILYGLNRNSLFTVNNETSTVYELSNSPQKLLYLGSYLYPCFIDNITSIKID